MQIYRSLSEVPPVPSGRALAVGTFDGVHLGHRRVIGSAIERARASGIPAGVVTFEPHPLYVLRPEQPPRLLTPIDVKADLIEDLGVDELIVIPFTEELARLDAHDFCGDVLAGALAARHVSVGQNFRFGYEAAGDAELLRSRPEFDVTVVPLVEAAGGTVSSSRIRELIERGDVAEAARLLGAPFQLEGTVMEGDARGRSLGMPTANLLPEHGVVLPRAGVYAGTALGHPAAINVGVRPTFEEDGKLLIEAYLLDFDGDLYGSRLQLAFLDRIRDEERFESAQELVEQMRRDVERTRQIAEAALSR